MQTPLRRALPNAITLARLILAVVFFALLQQIDRAAPAAEIALIGAWAMGLFATAAVSDILDGYLARRWGVVTVFGRIMDPLVDKIGSGIHAWMVVVILLRELLVTGIRSYIEARGIPFPADWSGKIKMFVQSFCVGCCVYVGTRIEPFTWQVILRDIFIWATVILTVLSSITYINRALRMAPEPEGPSS